MTDPRDARGGVEGRVLATQLVVIAVFLVPLACVILATARFCLWVWWLVRAAS